MSHIIKFKGWDTVRNRWITDFLIDCNGRARALSKSNFYYNGIHDTIIKICLFTGLTDLNGKDIYEGDCLGDVYTGGYISYCDNCKSFQYHLQAFGCMACEGDVHWYEIVEEAENGELKVIGNIYENPELINK